MLARLDPAGTSVLYLLAAAPGDLSGLVRMMRVPLAGGAPQAVLTEPGINNLQCARNHSDVCVFSQFDNERLTFYSFDSVSGKHSLLKTIQDPEWFLENWSLSPDGTTLVLAKKHRGAIQADIRVLRLDGTVDRPIHLENWFGISYVDWAADGKSIWVNAANSAGTQTVLNVNLNGKAVPFLEESEMELGWAIPSPDGRYHALWQASGNSNVWMIENF